MTSSLFDHLPRPGASARLAVAAAPREDDDPWYLVPPPTDADAPPEDDGYAPPPEDEGPPGDHVPRAVQPTRGAERAAPSWARSYGAEFGDPADLTKGLNPQQREAVMHEGSPLLILAGAGSGKTRVLTHRIAYLLATGRARPGEIIAITFTNKAAAEMRERVADLVGPAARHMWVSTFHSACVRILRRDHAALNLRSSFSIYDAADSQRLMTLVCKALDLDPKRFPPKTFSRRVSDLKNELVTPDAFEATADVSNPVEINLAKAYREYNRRLREANALDFDDIIMRTVELLQSHPAVAEHYHRRFRHVLVDEYQDTNHAQYVLVRLLTGETGELTVVGDADQSIYAFRGATIRNIEEFEEDYPNARTIMLEQNYRSTQNILSAANAVIENNAGRRKKHLWTDSGDGPQITGYVADSDHDEARFVTEEVDRLTAAGGPESLSGRRYTYGDVAVFYRTNAQSRSLEEMFVRAGIPYRVVGGTRFYERKEIKDVVAYLRVLANPDDAVNLRRVLNVPKRGLGERAESMLVAHSERERVPLGRALADVAGVDRELPDGTTQPAPEVLGMATRARTQMTEFHNLLVELRQIAAQESVADVVDAVLDRTGYLAQLRGSEDPQDQVRVENLAELHAVAAEFAAADPEADLADFLERVSLVADSDQVPDQVGAEQQGEVTLMTVHTAKGLEFPVVFVTGLEDGTFPHQRSLVEDDQLGEERRLAYVALTRARERLYVSRAAVRNSFGMPNQLPASRFLTEIPEEVVDWRRAESTVEKYGGSYGGGTFRGGVYNRVGREGDGGAGGRGGRPRDPWGEEDDGYVIGSGRPRRSGGGTGTSGPARYRREEAPAPSFGTAASREEADIPELAVGDRVTHDSYGLGTVVGIEGAGRSATARIDFGKGQTKRLLLRFSPVTKL